MTPAPTPDATWLWENEPCRAACPVHTDAGAYVTAIAEGRFRDAYVISRAPNPFASICGTVCFAPCEVACRRGKVDKPIAIRALKRFVSERYGVESSFGNELWHEAHGPVPPATGPSVGVIGAGPAGLAAAYELRLQGHPVTVYEAEDRLGGMMLLGIPEYRLSRELIEQECQAIIELGIDVQLGCRIGRDVNFDALVDRHDALFVGVGLYQGRGLNIPGHDADGVFKALEFLLNIGRGFKADLAERVVIVGGGNVAFDAARTALRVVAGDLPMAAAVLPTPEANEKRIAMTTTLDAARAAKRAGVREVTVVCLESREEMPAAEEEIEEAEAEGIVIVNRRGPQRITTENGRVTGLETIDVLSVFDAQHRFSPTFSPGTEKVIATDTVILAVGQGPEVGFIPADIERARFGGLSVNAEFRTSHPKVWAGGDVAFGPRNLIDAIGDGRRAAASIHAALSRTKLDIRGVRIELVAKPDFKRISSDYDAVPRVHIPAIPHERRIGFVEVEQGYTESDAIVEGQRCLRCFENIMLRPELCILCGLCVDVCPHNCITIERADRTGHGHAAQSVLLLDEEVCIRCALCVDRCPPHALVMVHAGEF